MTIVNYNWKPGWKCENAREWNWNRNVDFIRAVYLQNPQCKLQQLFILKFDFLLIQFCNKSKQWALEIF